VNTTDPDCHLLKARRGFVQGYNAQAVVNEHQIVIAAEIRTTAADFGHLEPMITAARRELRAAGVTEEPQVVLTDAGYWHQPQMEHLVADRIEVLIRPDGDQRKGTRPGWNGGYYAFMRRVLETELGGGLYRKRKTMIEPVFGHTTYNRRADRFQRRGRSAVRSEWRLLTATHNLMKLHALKTAPATPDRHSPRQPAQATRAARTHDRTPAPRPFTRQPHANPTAWAGFQSIGSMAIILVMPETLPLAAVKARFSEIVDRVSRQQDRVIVTRNGQPAAVLVGTDDLESLEETLAIMSDRSLMAQIRASEKAATAGDPGTELDELRADLARRRPARK
jgi:prevent-host-death family protein